MSASKTPATAGPVFRQFDEIPQENVEVGGMEQACYRMVFSADRTDTRGMTVGIATVGPDRPLPRHCHAHSEIYMVLEGDAEVAVDDTVFRLSPGSALFIPGNLEHAVHSSSQARLLFAFAADSYEEVRYVYVETR